MISVCVHELQCIGALNIYICIYVCMYLVLNLSMYVCICIIV